MKLVEITEAEQKVIENLRNIKYGNLTVIVQNGQIMYVDRTDREKVYIQTA